MPLQGGCLGIAIALRNVSWVQGGWRKVVRGRAEVLEPGITEREARATWQVYLLDVRAN
jgi:hypothetical protein